MFRRVLSSAELQGLEMVQVYIASIQPKLASSIVK